MTIPIWLPNLFVVDPWTNDTYDELYEIFRNDFIKSQIEYQGYNVWFFPEMEDGKEKIFWHFTSKVDNETEDRLPDLRRSERLPWARPLLENHLQPEVLAWDHEEGDGSIKTYVWLKDFDYVIIMKKISNGSRRLITSFWLEYRNAKEKLMKKYDRRICM
jgi:hypothetical protein